MGEVPLYTYGFTRDCGHAPEGGPTLVQLDLFITLLRRVSLVSGNPYRGISLTRKLTPLGPYRRTVPRVLGGS